jgi:diketogulonate reductase-like aldo/keto reductase
LIHRTQVGFEEPWKGLEDAVAQGLTKSIGLSNFHEDDMARIFKVAKVKPVNLQVFNFIYTFIIHQNLIIINILRS